MGLKNGNLRLLITIGVMLVGVASAWGVMKATVDSVETKTEKLQDEKADKEAFQEVQQDVKDMTVKVAKIETRQENIENDIKEIKEDMKEGFKAIMEKLNEN